MSVDEAIRNVVRDEVRSVVRDELKTLAQENPGRSAPVVNLIDAESAAKLVGVTAPTIRRWAREGKVPARLAGTRWRIDVRDLLASMSRHERSSDEVFDIRARAEEIVNGLGR